MEKVIDTVELIEMGVKRYNSLSALSRKTNINLATLRRIRHGHTTKPYKETILALIKALQ